MVPSGLPGGRAGREALRLVAIVFISTLRACAATSQSQLAQAGR
jgi:hypothetical protein